MKREQRKRRNKPEKQKRKLKRELRRMNKKKPQKRKIVQEINLHLHLQNVYGQQRNSGQMTLTQMYVVYV